MKIFRSCIMTGVLVVLLLMAGRYFLTSYKAYVAHKEIKAVLVHKIGWLSQLKSEREHQLHSILRINNFVNNAKLLGLEQNKWDVYNVDIENSVTFSQMKTILKQCSNSNSHYFRPVSFHIKSLKATGNSETASGKTFENEAGDILMTLKGAFVVKN
jgi:cell division protein FtsL